MEAQKHHWVTWKCVRPSDCWSSDRNCLVSMLKSLLTVTEKLNARPTGTTERAVLWHALRDRKLLLPSSSDSRFPRC